MAANFLQMEETASSGDFLINEHTIAQASHLNKEENEHLHAHVVLSAKSQNW